MEALAMFKLYSNLVSRLAFWGAVIMIALWFVAFGFITLDLIQSWR